MSLCTISQFQGALLEATSRLMPTVPKAPTQNLSSTQMRLFSSQLSDWIFKVVAMATDDVLDYERHHHDHKHNHSHNSGPEVCLISKRDRSTLIDLKQAVEKQTLTISREAHGKRVSQSLVNKSYLSLDKWVQSITYWLFEVSSVTTKRHGPEAGLLVLVYEFLDHVVLHQHWACGLFPLALAIVYMPKSCIAYGRLPPKSNSLKKRTKFALLSPLSDLMITVKDALREIHFWLSGDPFFLRFFGKIYTQLFDPRLAEIRRTIETFPHEEHAIREFWSETKFREIALVKNFEPLPTGLPKSNRAHLSDLLRESSRLISLASKEIPLPLKTTSALWSSIPALLHLSSKAQSASAVSARSQVIWNIETFRLQGELLKYADFVHRIESLSRSSLTGVDRTSLLNRVLDDISTALKLVKETLDTLKTSPLTETTKIMESAVRIKTAHLQIKQLRRNFQIENFCSNALTSAR